MILEFLKERVIQGKRIEKLYRVFYHARHREKQIECHLTLSLSLLPRKIERQQRARYRYIYKIPFSKLDFSLSRPHKQPRLTRRAALRKIESPQPLPPAPIEFTAALSIRAIRLSRKEKTKREREGEREKSGGVTPSARNKSARDARPGRHSRRRSVPGNVVRG